MHQIASHKERVLPNQGSRYLLNGLVLVDVGQYFQEDIGVCVEELPVEL